MVLILAALAGSAAAQDIGRLFTTLSERSALNQRRLEAQFARPEAESAPEPVQSEDPAPVQGPTIARLRIDGVVRRSRGPGTVWLNGAQVERGVVSREGVRVDTSPRVRDGVRVRLPSGLRSIRLKPGQAIDVATGTLVDAFERSPDARAASAFSVDVPAAPGASAGAAAVPDSSTVALTPDVVAEMSVAERKRIMELLLKAGASILGTEVAQPRPALESQ